MLTRPSGSVGTWLVQLPLGLVVASENAVVFKSRNYLADGTRPGFIFCAALSAGSYNIVGSGPAYELARRGYPVICGDLGDVPTAFAKGDGPGIWGNAQAVTKMGTLKTFLQGTLGAKAGKIGLIYGSHGCAAAYSYAAANPNNVSCIAGVIGTCDVEDIRANNRGSGSGFQASIETAYTNNAGWQAARSTHNPVEIAASLAIPQLDYYSTDDPWCVPSTHAALATAAGSNMTQRSLGAVGHTVVGLGPPGGQVATDKVTAFVDWVESKVAA